MNFFETVIKGVYIITPNKFEDSRGYFMETYSLKSFSEYAINECFVQDNQSYTKEKGTIRGIHFQNNPMAQGKLVRVMSGSVLDVAVDLRKGSPTYKKWVSVELTGENKKMLYIPRGFGHGFLTLSSDVVFFYKVDNLYSPSDDRGIRFDDPELNIDWGIKNPILSNKDSRSPYLKDSDCNFIFDSEN